jgi:hypothetical protein
MSARFAMYDIDGALQILELAGREEWALSHLLAGGSTGLAEPHGGQFVGTHGRCILRSKVERLGAMEMAT